MPKKTVTDTKQKPQQNVVDTTKRENPDDAHLARDMKKDWAGQYAFFRDYWHKYTNGYWERLELEEMFQEIRDYMEQQRWRGVKVNTKEMRSLEKMYRTHCYVRQEKIDVAPQYLNMSNGLLNLETLTHEDHRRDLYFTWQLDYDYNPYDTCPTFMRYLATTFIQADEKPDHEVIALLQEALGYSLTADTSRKASFWLYGVPNSGKSTFVTLIRNLMGKMHYTVDLNQLGANKFMLSNIAGKRVITTTEAAANSHISDADYKTLVGGSDQVFGDVKHGKPVVFVPQAKTWWAMNDMPRTSDRSGAVLNRIHIIPFTRAIPDDMMDGNLDAKLYRERAGILNWALQGLKRLTRNDTFTRPAVSERLRHEYKMQNDIEANFLKECYIIDPDSEVQASELYHEYRDWCKENGFDHPKSVITIAKEWRRLGLIHHERNAANYWRGVRSKKVKVDFRNL